MRRLLLVLIAALLLTAGCGGSSFLGRRVGDFRAYYNTFYNAKKAYEDAMRAFENQEERVDQATYLALFPGPESAPVRENLQRAIKKSADVLRKYPRSRWVDDALMLIGKSYFYQANFVGAERKFREVLALAEGPKQEARFWLARTLLTAGATDEAALFLQEHLGEVSGDSRMRLLLGVLHVQQGAWPEAVAALRQGLERVEDDRLAARAQLLLGQVLETMDHSTEAAAAYDRAAAQHAGYELRYAAQVGAVRALGKAGRGVEALDRLHALLSDDKNADRQAELMLLRGRVYQILDRADAARRAYRLLLYGKEVNVAPVRGRAHYALGTLYRDTYHDYVRAAAHFDTASTALAQPSSSFPRTSVAVTNSQALAESFGTLAEVTHRVHRLDSLLHLGSLSEADFQAFVQALRQRRARELAATASAQRERAVDAGFENTRFSAGAGNQQQLATTDADSDVGFLFHNNPARVQQARAAFFQQWGRRPHVRNWRRLNAVSAAGTTATGADAEAEALAQGEGAGLPGADAGLPQVDVSAVPRDSASRAAMRAERTRAHYELGNALFLVVGLPDSAAFWYRRVIEERPEASVAHRARYALAEVARAQGDTARARRRYRRLIEQYPTSGLAVLAREQLRADSSTTPLEGAPGQAERDYAQAYAQWQRGRYADAVEHFVRVAAHYRTTDAAPRALLAAGQTALEWIRHDTVDFGRPLPVSLPDSLFAPGGYLAIAHDSLAASRGPDTLNAARALPDTARALPDTARALPDAVATDTAQASSPPPLPDTAQVQVPVETQAAVSPARDTIRTVPDTSVRRDTAVVHESYQLRVKTLFAGLIVHYPETPEAEQARLVLPLLRARIAAADSLRHRRVMATQWSDSVRALGGTAFASVDTLSAADAILADSTLLHGVSVDSTALFGRAPLDLEGDVWTIVVTSGRERSRADAVITRLRRQGYRTGLLTTRSEGRLHYRVAVGRFETRAAARTALHRHARTLPASSRVLHVSAQRN